LGFVPVHADGVTDEESAFVIETAHDGVSHEGRGCDRSEGETCGESVGRGGGVGLIVGDDGGALGGRRDLGTLIWREIGGGERGGDEKEGDKPAHQRSTAMRGSGLQAGEGTSLGE